jgi:hypothetical protein
MKKLVFALAMVVFIWILPMVGNAIPMMVWPSSPDDGSYYLDYDVSWDSGVKWDQAFCVDMDQYAPGVETDYTLMPLTEDIDFLVAWIADKYAGLGDPFDPGNDSLTPNAQVAIWEVISDSTYSLSGGSYSTSKYDTLVVNGILLDAVGLDINDLKDSTYEWNYNWMIATNNCYQDYLVRRVPETSSLLLLGTGLVGLAGFKRKFKA